MGSENEIQRYAACDECFCLDMADNEGQYVLHADHVASRQADQERIAELGLMLGWAMDWIADCCEKPLEDEEPGPYEKWERANAALAAFRASLSTGETD